MVDGWELGLFLLFFFGVLVAIFVMGAGRPRSLLGEVPGMGPPVLGSRSAHRLLVLRPRKKLAPFVRLQYRATGHFVMMTLEPWEARQLADQLMVAYRGARPEELPPGAEGGKSA